MKVSELVELLEKECPKALAESWDNPGLLVGDPDTEVKKVYIALDATSDVIEEAARVGADMLITHHPLIFKGLLDVTQNDFVGKRVMALIKNNIAFFCMHTNFDVAFMGELLRKKLGLPEGRVLMPLESEPSRGMGGLAALPDDMTLGHFSLVVKDALGVNSVRVYGDLSNKLSIAAFLPGSGKSAIDCAIDSGADVLVTGDIDHHTGIDAVEKGISIIDAGHWGMEHFFVDYVALFLKGNTGSLEIATAPLRQPYKEV